MTTLVIGGTGKTGRRISGRLVAREFPVRIGSRWAEIPFDWENQATWEPALAHVDAVYISYYPDLAIPGAVEAVEALVGLARQTGVRRLVFLSGRGEEEAQRAERVVQRSGLEWTIVRAAWFSQNFSENYLLEPILSGEVVLPAGEVGEPFVDAEDIAEVAAAALVDREHAGQIYELTGPRLLTFREAVNEISGATGREILFTPVAMDEYRALLNDAAVPGEFIELLTYLFSEVLDGRNASLADGVERALGRKPRDFSDYARDAAASGVWAVRHE